MNIQTSFKTIETIQKFTFLFLLSACSALPNQSALTLVEPFTPAEKEHVIQVQKASAPTEFEKASWSVDIPFAEAYLTRIVSELTREIPGFSVPVQVFIFGSAGSSLPEVKQFHAYTSPEIARIYVHWGLLTEVDNADELAFVLAHELAHIVNKDFEMSKDVQAFYTGLHTVSAIPKITSSITQGVTKEQNSSTLEKVQNTTKTISEKVTRYSSIAYEPIKGIINSLVSRDEERADALAMELLLRTGYNSDAAICTMDKIKKADDSWKSAALPEKLFDDFLVSTAAAGGSFLNNMVTNLTGSGGESSLGSITKALGGDTSNEAAPQDGSSRGALKKTVDSTLNSSLKFSTSLALVTVSESVCQDLASQFRINHPSPETRKEYLKDWIKTLEVYPDYPATWRKRRELVFKRQKAEFENFAIQYKPYSQAINSLDELWKRYRNLSQANVPEQANREKTRLLIEISSLEKTTPRNISDLPVFRQILGEMRIGLKNQTVAQAQASLNLLDKTKKKWDDASARFSYDQAYRTALEKQNFQEAQKFLTVGMARTNNHPLLSRESARLQEITNECKKQADVRSCQVQAFSKTQLPVDVAAAACQSVLLEEGSKFIDKKLTNGNK